MEGYTENIEFITTSPKDWTTSPIVVVATVSVLQSKTGSESLLGEKDWTTVSNKGEKYHIFLKGRIYNLLSLSITFVDDDRTDIRKTIFELFERYDFNFKKLNGALNGDYALVIGKEVAGKITEIWMSTDHIANVKLYYLVQSPSAPFAKQTGSSKIKFSLKPFETGPEAPDTGPEAPEKAFEMPGGCMLNLRLDDDGNIKEEIFMDYEEEYNSAIGAGNCKDIIRDISSAYVLIGFALDCIIEKRLKHTKKVYKGESREDKYIMKVARIFNEDIEEVEEKGKKVISGN
jgi:asparagine synthetase B (glutamine-hydrolysing)